MQSPTATLAPTGVPLLEIDPGLIPEVSEYADLVSIAADLDRVNTYCERLFNLVGAHGDDSLLVDALYVAALIRYRRCFTTGKRSSLDEAAVADLPGASATHRYYLDLASKLAAHSVNPFERTGAGVMLGQTADGQHIVVGVGHLSAKLIAPDRDGASTLGKLARAFRDHVQARVKALEAAISSAANALTQDQLRALKPLTFTAPGPDAAGKARK